MEQNVEKPPENVSALSNITTHLHHDIERIQEQRHKQFQYVCDKYRDEIPPNVSHHYALLKVQPPENFHSLDFGNHMVDSPPQEFAPNYGKSWIRTWIFFQSVCWKLSKSGLKFVFISFVIVSCHLMNSSLRKL